MDGTKIFDKLSQLSNLEYEIFGRDTHKYNIIRYFDKIHSEKDNYILKIKELKETNRNLNEKINEMNKEVKELREKLKKLKTKTCSICGETGHNKIGCPSKKV